MIASGALPYGLPQSLWDAVEEWLNGLVDRGILLSRPAAENMTVALRGPLAHRVHVHPDTFTSDVYAWADFETDPATARAHGEPWVARLLSEGWGNYEPVHDSDRLGCRCEECEERRTA